MEPRTVPASGEAPPVEAPAEILARIDAREREIERTLHEAREAAAAIVQKARDQAQEIAAARREQAERGAAEQGALIETRPAGARRRSSRRGRGKRPPSARRRKSASPPPPRGCGGRPPIRAGTRESPMIVPMALVRIYGPRELLDEATCILYELEALHPEALPPEFTARISVRDRRTEDRAEVHERVELERSSTRCGAASCSCRSRSRGGRRPRRRRRWPSCARGRRDGTSTRSSGASRRSRAGARRRPTASRSSASTRRWSARSSPSSRASATRKTSRWSGFTLAREQQAVVALLDEQLRRATDGLAQVFSTEVDEHTVPRSCSTAAATRPRSALCSGTAI